MSESQVWKPEGGGQRAREVLVVAGVIVTWEVTA